MPNIILPSGEILYKAMSDSVSTVFSDLKGFINLNVLIFDSKKLPNGSRFCEIDHLNDKSNVYIVNKQSVEEDKESKLIDIKKYQKLYDGFTDDEQVVVRNHYCDPENLKKIILHFPALNTDQEAFNLLCDFTFFVNCFYKHPSFIGDHYVLFRIFKQVVDTVVTNRSTKSATNNFSPSSSNQVPFGFGRQPSSSNLQVPSLVPTNTITSQMLQQALDFIGFTNTTTNDSLPLSAIAPANNPIDQRSANQHLSSMEVDQNYTTLLQTYALQLEQMHEFGFENDKENLCALMMSDGSLESALELVISFRFT